MKNLFLLAFTLLFQMLFSQLSGNQIYKNRNSYEYPATYYPEAKHFAATDSTLIINVNILLNQKADKFKITFGLNEEAETPKKAIENINTRINNYINKINYLAIKKNMVFVDFISQTKIYDFDIETNQKIISQKIKGFEVKKNIIITTDDYSKIEKLIYEASDFQIYDIIKVDYINTNIEQIQQNMMKEAYSILERKKDDYFKNIKREIIGTPVANSNFSYMFPKSQYQNYTAFETSDFDVMRGNYNNDNYIKKLERKGKTFYYEGAGYSGYDKVINDDNPEIGIQYVLNLSLKYDIRKNKKDPK